MGGPYDVEEDVFGKSVGKAMRSPSPLGMLLCSMLNLLGVDQIQTNPNVAEVMI